MVIKNIQTCQLAGNAGDCMNTRGGARPGSGRPQGGISDTRRRIIAAINMGLAQAGRKKYPNAVSQIDDDQAAIQTGAMIVDDMIQAGQGNDVMKLWAAVALKEGSDPKGDKRNTLAEALSRLPVAGHVADVTQNGKSQPEALQTEGGATHPDREEPRNTPYFAPQVPLMLDDPLSEPPPTVCDDKSNLQTTAANYRQASQPAAPPTDRQGAPPSLPLCRRGATHKTHALSSSRIA